MFGHLRDYLHQENFQFWVDLNHIRFIYPSNSVKRPLDEQILIIMETLHKISMNITQNFDIFVVILHYAHNFLEGIELLDIISCRSVSVWLVSVRFGAWNYPLSTFIKMSLKRALSCKGSDHFKFTLTKRELSLSPCSIFATVT